MAPAEKPHARESEALRFIRNALVHGRSPSVRQVQAALGYRSPRSAAQILNRLIDAGVLARREDGRLQLRNDPEPERGHARTVDVPLVGSAPCGQPMLAEENLEAWVPVATELAKPPHRYFLLRARGDSMNAAGIADRDLVLVRQQATAENGQIVVALVDDEATIKEISLGQGAITLLPRSRDTRHRPIIVAEGFQVQGVIIASIPAAPVTPLRET